MKTKLIKLFLLLLISLTLFTACDPDGNWTGLFGDSTPGNTTDDSGDESSDDNAGETTDDSADDTGDDSTGDTWGDSIDNEELLEELYHHHILYDISAIEGSIAYSDGTSTGNSTANFDVTISTTEDAKKFIIGLPDINSQIVFSLKWIEGTGYTLNDELIALYKDYGSSYTYYPMGSYGSVDAVSREDETIETITIAATSPWRLDWFDNHEETITALNITLRLTKTGYMAVNMESSLTAEELRFLDTRNYREQAETTTLALLQTDPENGLPQYIEEVLEGVTDDGIKLKILYDFIIHYLHYDWDAYTSGSAYITAPYEVLPVRRTVCSGYARLLVEAARLAGIPVYETGGGAKGYSYAPDEDLPGHAWNFIKFNDRFLFLDGTWDSAGKYQNETYSEGTERWSYFLVPPEIFISDHLPFDTDYQFLNSPISETAFRNSDDDGGNPSYITEEFFNYDLNFSAESRPDFTADKGYTSFIVESDYPIRAYISSDNQTKVFTDPHDDDWEVFISFPSAGIYKLHLNLIDGEAVLSVGAFQFEALKGDPYLNLSTRYLKADEYEADLITPDPHGFVGETPSTLSLSLAAGTEPAVWFYDAPEEGIRLGTTALSSSIGTLWTASLDPPEGTELATIMAREGDSNSWWGLYKIPWGNSTLSSVSAARTALPSLLPEYEDLRNKPTMPKDYSNDSNKQAMPGDLR